MLIVKGFFIQWSEYRSKDYVSYCLVILIVGYIGEGQEEVRNNHHRCIRCFILIVDSSNNKTMVFVPLIIQNY